jgi:3-hydroxyacyl-CoA dehydrogenase
MSPGIAQIFAIGGYDITMWARREETREKAKETLKKSLETSAEKVDSREQGQRNFRKSKLRAYGRWRRDVC